MSPARLLFSTNKAATGWAALVRRNCAAPALPYCAALVRRNCAAPALPYCAALARRIGTASALPSCSSFPYCATLARRNATAPALPSVSPSPYCISFFIGLRHMSSNGRRAFLLDKIALGLEAEGIPYTEALDKTINKFFNETSEIKELLNENLEDVDQGFEGEIQKMCSELDKIRSKLQSFQMSKESTLTDAIDFIGQLQKEVLDLQTELADEEGKKQGSASSSPQTMAPLQNVQYQEKFELSPIGLNKLHLKITCGSKRGWFTKLVEAICSLGLEMTQVNSVTFSGVSQTMLCVEAKDDHKIPMAELKKVLSGIV